MELYLIKSKDGKYYRSKGYGGYGNNWVDKPEQAKIFTRLGTARQIVSWWANAYPEFGAPQLVKLIVTKEEAIPVDLNEIKRNKLKRELATEKRSLKWKQQRSLGESNETQRNIDKLEKQIAAIK